MRMLSFKLLQNLMLHAIKDFRICYLDGSNIVTSYNTKKEIKIID